MLKRGRRPSFLWRNKLSANWIEIGGERRAFHPGQEHRQIPLGAADIAYTRDAVWEVHLGISATVGRDASGIGHKRRADPARARVGLHRGILVMPFFISIWLVFLEACLPYGDHSRAGDQLAVVTCSHRRLLRRAPGQ